MTTTHRRTLLAGAAAGLLAAPGLALGQSRDPIRVGAVGPYSGNAAAFGISMREAIEVVVEQRNRAGGLLGGRQVQVVWGDDAGRPEEATNLARRFATRDRVSVALGSVSSPASLAAAQVFRDEEVAQITISATAQRITRQGNEWVFRSAVPDRKLVSDMVDFIAERFPNHRRFGFIYVNDDFGKGGFDSFVEFGRARGFAITTEERYSRGDIDFTAQLTRIRQSNPDAIVDWSRYAEGALVARQIRQMQLPQQLYGSDGIAPPAYIELAGEAANGVIYCTHFSPATASGPVAERFIAQIRAAFNKPADMTHAQAFDAATIALDAIERARSADRRAVRDAIRQTSFESVRGPFRFDQTGDPTLVTHMVRVVNGRETNARATAAG
jgi:branched-chain amino acid transport system substrate-binding protein